MQDANRSGDEFNGDGFNGDWSNGDGGPEEASGSRSPLMRAEARRAIEAVVMVATDPMPVSLLAQLIELPAREIDEICRELADEYRRDERGFQFVEVAGGWRYQSHADCAPYVERFILEGQASRLSTAALETLSIIAYKQPISRAQVSAIRGVNVDGVLRTLLHRGYVHEVGRDEGPGQAVLFGTTPLFLERVGLASVEQLPPLGDFVPGAHVVEALEQTLRVGPDELYDDEGGAQTEADSDSIDLDQIDLDRIDRRGADRDGTDDV